MIRRGFWLLAGAALGVTGYRRVSRLARTIGGGPAAPTNMRLRSAAAPPSMRLRSAAAFVRDVRAGMADYRELRGGQLGRRLKDQRDRSQSGTSQQGRVEP